MIGFIVSALKVIFILGFLIFIHEGGHFLVAKLCRVTVHEFAIGFGPTIWKKQGKTTQYALRLIPLGGFVRMEGEEERSEKEGSFSKASIPKRIAIVVAGGFVNIIFAFLVYGALMTYTGGSISNIIKAVVPEESAQIAGLQEQDEIIKINGKSIHTKNDLDKAMQESNGENIELTIKRNGEKQKLQIQPSKQTYANTGIYLKADEQTNEIVALAPNSPAERQGLQVKDNIIKVNDYEVIGNQQELVNKINESQGEIIFTIERKGSVLEVKVTPEILSHYYLGIYLQEADNTITSRLYYAFWNTKDFAFSIIDNLKMLFTGKVAMNQLMGPVGISSAVARYKGH